MPVEGHQRCRGLGHGDPSGALRPPHPRGSTRACACAARMGCAERLHGHPHRRTHTRPRAPCDARVACACMRRRAATAPPRRRAAPGAPLRRCGGGCRHLDRGGGRGAGGRGRGGSAAARGVCRWCRRRATERPRGGPLAHAPWSSARRAPISFPPAPPAPTMLASPAGAGLAPRARALPGPCGAWRPSAPRPLPPSPVRRRPSQPTHRQALPVVRALVRGGPRARGRVRSSNAPPLALARPPAHRAPRPDPPQPSRDLFAWEDEACGRRAPPPAQRRTPLAQRAAQVCVRCARGSTRRAAWPPASLPHAVARAAHLHAPRARRVSAARAPRLQTADAPGPRAPPLEPPRPPPRRRRRSCPCSWRRAPSATCPRRTRHAAAAR